MKNAPLVLPWLGALLSFLAAAACRSAPVVEGNPGLAGSSWTCTAIRATPVAGAELTLVFDEAGGASGHAGVNRWFGACTLEAGPDGAGAVSFARLGATRMAGPAPLMAQEQRYLAALGVVSGYRRSGARLLLSDGRAVVVELDARP